MKRQKKYTLRFRVDAPGLKGSGNWLGLVYEADTMLDIRRKVKFFKGKSMPWSYDFKVTNNDTGQTKEL